MTTPDGDPLERARALLQVTPLVDGHNDLAEALRRRAGLATSTVDLDQPVASLMTDIPRLRAGRVGAQFWSVWVPASLPEPQATRRAFEQLDIVRRMIARYPETFESARTADDVERIFGDGRIASLIGLEGGSMIGSSLPILRQFHALGVGYMTLTHWLTTRWADAATDPPRHGGLTPFGIEVVHEMNRLGMLVDLSHVAPTTMAAALDATEAPVVFSHSGARAVTDHPRNVPDEILGRLDVNGGLVMAVFLAGFVSAPAAAYEEEVAGRIEAIRHERPEAAEPELDGIEAAWRLDHPGPGATIGDVADHIDHLRDAAGIDHVGIGSDLDGGAAMPAGLDDVAHFPDLFAELIRRRYTDPELRAIAGSNVLRVMRDAEVVAARLQGLRGPSERTIEELDGELDDQS
ncbi:MAG TPA: dipeptidase [Candidatus Limnocylindrales bacterium]